MHVLFLGHIMTNSKVKWRTENIRLESIEYKTESIEQRKDQYNYITINPSMDKAEHFEKLKNIITVYLPEDVSPEDIDKNSTFIEQLNINSAHMVDIVLDVEEAFDILLENEDLENMRTVNDALLIIDNKLADKG